MIVDTLIYGAKFPWPEHLQRQAGRIKGAVRKVFPATSTKKPLIVTDLKKMFPTDVTIAGRAAPKKHTIEIADPRMVAPSELVKGKPIPTAEVAAHEAVHVLSSGPLSLARLRKSIGKAEPGFLDVPGQPRMGIDRKGHLREGVPRTQQQTFKSVRRKLQSEMRKFSMDEDPETYAIELQDWSRLPSTQGIPTEQRRMMVNPANMRVVAENTLNRQGWFKRLGPSQKATFKLSLASRLTRSPKAVADWVETPDATFQDLSRRLYRHTRWWRKSTPDKAFSRSLLLGGF